MAISFIAFAQGSGTGATFTTAPSQGDLLIATCINNSTPPPVGSGWTQIDSLNSTQDGISAFKICGASETTLQSPAGSGSSNVFIAQFRADAGFAAQPIGTLHSVKQGTSATPPTVTSTAVTPAKANAAAFLSAYSANTTDTAPTSVSGMTKIATLSGGATGNGIGAYQLLTGTASYSKTVTWSGSTAGVCCVFVVTFIEATYTSTPTGSITPAGTESKFTKTTRTGSITPAGSASRFISLTRPGSITPAGSINRATTAQLAGGSITAASAIAKQAQLPTVGSITAVSNLATLYIPGGHHYTQTVNASITPAGTANRAIGSQLTGSITAASSASRFISLPEAGSITAAGAAAKITSRTLPSGAITGTGSLSKQAGVPIAGSITPAGSSAKQTAYTVTGSTTPAGTINRALSLIRTGSITAVGAIKRLTSIIRTGSITGVSTLTPSQLLFKALAGSITAISSLAKTVIIGRSGSITQSGSISKTVELIRNGSITPQSAMHRGYTILLSGILAPIGTVAKRTAKQIFTGIINAVSSLTTGQSTFTPTIMITEPVIADARVVAKVSIDTQVLNEEVRIDPIMTVGPAEVTTLYIASALRVEEGLQ